MSELKCNQCLLGFGDKKIPKMMPSCLHNICSQCLEDIFDDRQKEIRCTFCTNIENIDNLHISNFVKNISLMHKQNSSTSTATKVVQDQPEVNLLKQSYLGEEHFVPQNQATTDVCVIHKRQKQLICITDKQKICSHCALFGNHQYHRIVTEKDIENEVNNISKSINQLLTEHREMRKNIVKKWNQKSIKQQIQFNKGLVLDKVYVWFESAKEELQKQQMKIQQEITALFDDIFENVKKDIQKLKQMEQQFDTWELTASNMVSDIEKNQYNFDKKIDYLFCVLPESKQKGQMKLQRLRYSFQEKRQQMQSNLKSIQIKQFKDPQYFGKQISSYIGIDKKIKMPKMVTPTSQLKNSSGNNSFRVSLEDSRVNNEQKQTKGGKNKIRRKSTDDITSTLNNTFSSCNLQTKSINHGKSQKILVGFKEKNQKSFKSPVKIITTKNQISRITSPKKNFAPDNSGQSSLVKSRFSARKNFSSADPEQKLTEFIKSSSDVLDLSGCEMEDQDIIKFIKSACDSKPVKNIKLMRNHLTNSGFNKIIPFLKGVINLNMAENSLTESVLDCLIMQKEELKKLRMVSIAHNRVNQRLAKTKVEELKKIGILVTL